MKHPKRMNPNLLEINAALFMYRMRRACGRELTIGTVPLHVWENIASNGFSHVWLMGVWQRSAGSKACALKEDALRKGYDSALPGWTEGDILGSPYAVHAYEVDPSLGEGHDLARLKADLNGLGLRLILDFVPNHLAFDHPLTEADPGLFVSGSPSDLEDDPALFFKTKKGAVLAHAKDPFFPPWGDTVQIDIFSEDARAALVRELKRIASLADGVRCDMAMLVLNDVFDKTWGMHLPGRRKPDSEFWRDAISEVKAENPSFAFIAEAYWDLEYTLQQLGFDYTYDKKLYDLMLHASAREVRMHLKGDESFQKRCVRFIENHDEERAITAFGTDKSLAAAAVMATVPGLHLFHDGQIQGEESRLPVQLARKQEEQENHVTSDFYRRLLSFASDPLMADGEWRVLDARPSWDGDESFESMLAWTWHKQGSLKLVAVNFSGSTSRARLKIKPESIETGPVTFRDALTGEIYVRTTEEIIGKGLYVELQPWKAHLFDLLS